MRTWNIRQSQGHSSSNRRVPSPPRAVTGKEGVSFTASGAGVGFLPYGRGLGSASSGPGSGSGRSSSPTVSGHASGRCSQHALNASQANCGQRQSAGSNLLRRFRPIWLPSQKAQTAASLPEEHNLLTMHNHFYFLHTPYSFESRDDQSNKHLYSILIALFYLYVKDPPRKSSGPSSVDHSNYFLTPKEPRVK